MLPSACAAGPAQAWCCGASGLRADSRGGVRACCVLQFQNLYGKKAAALYTQAGDYQKTARFYYKKAEDTYYQVRAVRAAVEGTDTSLEGRTGNSPVPWRGLGCWGSRWRRRGVPRRPLCVQSTLASWKRRAQPSVLARKQRASHLCARGSGPNARGRGRGFGVGTQSACLAGTVCDS